MLASENKLKNKRKEKPIHEPVELINGPTASKIRRWGVTACIRRQGRSLPRSVTRGAPPGSVVWAWPPAFTPGERGP